MDNVRLTFLFDRFINRTCSESERRELLALISDPANDVQVKSLMGELWSHVSPGKLSSDASERILLDILGSDQSPRAARPSYLFQKVAASIVLALISLGSLYYFTRPYVVPAYVTETSDEESSLRFFELPDGSTVVLNAGSRLDYPPFFSDSVREVFLEGEGYFDIIPHPSKRFVVRTGKITTTVLGTAFNIRAYADQKNITITVKRGKVQVSSEKNVIGIINRNQQISFDTREDRIQQTTVKSEEVTAWMEKDIFFEDITFVEAIDQLEKRFESSIDVENGQLSECRFTGTFVKGEDLRQILTILCEFNSATLKEKPAGGFVIEGGKCPL